MNTNYDCLMDAVMVEEAGDGVGQESPPGDEGRAVILAQNFNLLSVKSEPEPEMVDLEAEHWPCEMLDLPPGSLSRILSHLTLRQKIRCRLVCLRFNNLMPFELESHIHLPLAESELANQIQEQWSNLPRRSPPMIVSVKSPMTGFKFLYPRISFGLLVIDIAETVHRPSITNDIIRALATHCPNLHTIIWPSAMVYLDCLPMITKLNRLSVGKLRLCPSSSAGMLAKFSELEQFFRENLSDLELLAINTAESFELLRHIATTALSLLTLGFYDPKVCSFSDLATRFPCLATLMLEFDKFCQISFSGLESFSQLRELSFAEVAFDDRDAEVWRQIFRHCPLASLTFRSVRNQRIVLHQLHLANQLCKLVWYACGDRIGGCDVISCVSPTAKITHLELHWDDRTYLFQILSALAEREWPLQTLTVARSTRFDVFMKTRHQDIPLWQKFLAKCCENTSSCSSSSLKELTIENYGNLMWNKVFVLIAERLIEHLRCFSLIGSNCSPAGLHEVLTNRVEVEAKKQLKWADTSGGDSAKKLPILQIAGDEYMVGPYAELETSSNLLDEACVEIICDYR